MAAEITVNVLHVAPTAPRTHYTAEYGGGFIATAEYSDHFEHLLITSASCKVPGAPFAVASLRGDVAQLLSLFTDDAALWLTGFLDKARQLHERKGGARV